MPAPQHGPRKLLPPLTLSLAVVLAAALPLGADDFPASRTIQLIDSAYPIEASISFPAALLHWMDSIAALRGPGMTAGKTVPAHRAGYDRIFGRRSAHEQQLVQRFGEIRHGLVRHREADGHADGQTTLLLTFYDAPDLGWALERTSTMMAAEDHRQLRSILEYFAPRYEKIWRKGKIPQRFIKRARGHRKFDDLEALLLRMADFFGVDPKANLPPRLILVPVDDGYGTHAQANGRHLLVELRPDDGLASTASVIVHENAHLLLARMDPERRRKLEAVLREMLGPGGGDVARHLREGLATAMGQGVADRKFRPHEWGFSRPWYHTGEIDRYAKRIYPLVEDALSRNGSFDEDFLRKVLSLHPNVRGVTRRSP